MSIGRFSVRNPVLVNILMISILVLGYLSLSRLPREQFSEVPFFWVNIIVPYPGVSAEDVEKSVTVKIENEFQGIQKLKEISSVSSEGLSLVRVQFDDGISNDEFQRLFQESQTRFSRVDLPDGTLKAVLDDFSSSDFTPVIEIVFSGDIPFSVLDETVRNIRDKLLRVSDVSGVDLIGSRDREILVSADRQKLEALEININELIQTIKKYNVSIPGGTLETGTKDYLLRTVSNLEDVEKIKKLIVRSGSSGREVIRIGDVAGVSDSLSEKGNLARLNGKSSVTLRIKKIPRSGSVSVIEDSRALVESQLLPQGMTYEFINDSTIQIRDSINTLINNAILGFLLLVFILFVFIGFRNALITALGIPVTFAITFIILEYMGQTFNGNTLFGLVLVLGMIVDHAIVIIENSFRLENEEGLVRHRAAVAGADQVVVPVIAATGTTIAAFLPLMLIPGTIGKFLMVIPLTVTIALVASTFESIVFIPSHYADWPGGRKKRKDRLFNRIRGAYETIIRRLYRHKRVTVAVLFIIMILGLALTATLKQDLFSSEDFTFFRIDIEMPKGTPLEKTDAFVSAYEKELVPLTENGEVTAIVSSIGFAADSGSNDTGGHIAQILVDLAERDEGRTRSITEIMKETELKLSYIAGAEVVNYSKATNGPPVSDPVSFRFFGDDYEVLQAISQDIRTRLSEYEDLFAIGDNLNPGTPELRIRLNSDRASALGLDPQVVGSFFRTSFDGVTATTVFNRNEETDVNVRFATDSSQSVYSLEQMKIPAADGRLIPFSSVATVEVEESLSGIKRVDGKREMTITAKAYSKDNIKLINSEIKRYFNENLQPVYPGVTLQVGGEFADLEDLLIQILRVFLIGIFLIYIILGTQFRSYTQPILILFTIPFAFVGVVLYLFFSGTPFSTTVLYAAVALAGIAVNDSIVLISFINELREQGMSADEAVLKASVTRLRPILLTSLTTIAGLVPTAAGFGGVSVVWGPMANTIIYGLIFSTLTALVFIPCLYGVLFQKQREVIDV